LIYLRQLFKNYYLSIRNKKHYKVADII